MYFRFIGKISIISIHKIRVSLLYRPAQVIYNHLQKLEPILIIHIPTHLNTFMEYRVF